MALYIYGFLFMMSGTQFSFLGLPIVNIILKFLPYCMQILTLTLYYGMCLIFRRILYKVWSFKRDCLPLPVLSVHEDMLCVIWVFVSCRFVPVVNNMGIVSCIFVPVVNNMGIVSCRFVPVVNNMGVCQL